MNEEHTNLETLRQELQELDLQLLMLLRERFTLSQKMGTLKRLQHLDIYQETEWQRKVSFVSGRLEGNPFSEEILRVFCLIHNESVIIQKKAQ